MFTSKEGKMNKKIHKMCEKSFSEITLDNIEDQSQLLYDGSSEWQV